MAVASCWTPAAAPPRPEDGLVDATPEADAKATRLARQKSWSLPSMMELLEGLTARLGTGAPGEGSGHGSGSPTTVRIGHV